MIIVFPELSLTGYEPDLAEELAFTAEDPRLDSLLEMALAHQSRHRVPGCVGFERLGVLAITLRPDQHTCEIERRAQVRRRSRVGGMMANLGGESGGSDSAGGSAIWSDSGELVARLEGPGAGIVTATKNASGWTGRSVSLRDA